MSSPMLLSLAQFPLPKSQAVSATRRVPLCDWSKLPLDLMQLVFERLGYLDFERAKLVCSTWHSGSKQSRRPNNKIPWMILFVVKENYCLLFNPEDKEKFYKSRHFGDNLSDSFCLTTYRSWLLMLNNYIDYLWPHHASYEMYIVDTLTSERINLPAIAYGGELRFQILWIDEKIKDYLVIGTARIYGEKKGTLVSLKKGNNSWKRFPQLQFLCDKNFNMVYKDCKIYCLDYFDLHIFDFCGEYPLQIFKISVDGYVFDKPRKRYFKLRLTIPVEYKRQRWKNNVIVTLEGDVLIVVSKRGVRRYTWEFKIYKMMDSSKWEEVVSLGDESILLDLGVTVLAKDLEGITSNSIYFTANHVANEYEQNKIFIFHLDTKKVEYPKPFIYSTIPISHAHWFLPSFKRE